MELNKRSYVVEDEIAYYTVGHVTRVIDELCQDNKIWALAYAKA